MFFLEFKLIIDLLSLSLFSLSLSLLSLSLFSLSLFSLSLSLFSLHLFFLSLSLSLSLMNLCNLLQTLFFFFFSRVSPHSKFLCLNPCFLHRRLERKNKDSFLMEKEMRMEHSFLLFHLFPDRDELVSNSSLSHLFIFILSLSILLFLFLSLIFFLSILSPSLLFLSFSFIFFFLSFPSYLPIHCNQ